MLRTALYVALLVLAAAVGAVGAGWALRPAPPSLPDSASVITQMREVAQVETLEVSLYKKVTFSPEPPATDSLWKDVFNWASYALHTPRGSAIVFADARLGYDLGKLGPESVRIDGARVDVVLPPLRTTVILKPGETEVIGSNLDTAQSAQLLELARLAFEKQVAQDARLKERARASAERSLRGLLFTLGFRDVRFVDHLPTAAHPG